MDVPDIGISHKERKRYLDIVSPCVLLYTSLNENILIVLFWIHNIFDNYIWMHTDAHTDHNM
jgi:hypothetical protein